MGIKRPRFLTGLKRKRSLNFTVTVVQAVAAVAALLVIGAWLLPQLCLNSSTSSASIPVNATKHRIKRIVDGDTVHLIDGTKVRLYGIDTPELKQPYGKQAKRALDSFLGQLVLVDVRDTDRYGRTVAVLYTPDELNVNLEMVCRGHAWWYQRYARGERAMAACQREAQEARLGLWADDEPVPPWEWRRGH